MPLVPPYIESLEPYSPGKQVAEIQRDFGLQKVVKLASNENPLGPSPLAVRELQKYYNQLHIYPNGGLDLREVLAERFHLNLANVVTGNGSEGIMSNIIRAFLCDEDEVLTSQGTFVGFYVLARSRGTKLITVPLKDYRFDLDALSERITSHTKIIYLVNPNNPTGTIFTKEEFDRFWKTVPENVLIILDEAYFEYAQTNPHYPDSMQYRYDNVITLRTFSKAFGLAGIRIGYGFAHDALISNLLKVKLPFEPSTLAQAGGIGALKDSEFLKMTLESNERGKKYLGTNFHALGLSAVPTDANFYCIPFPSEDAALQVYSSLLRRGVIVRPLRAFGLPHCLRLTIGTDEQNDFLLAKLESALRDNLPTV